MRPGVATQLIRLSSWKASHPSEHYCCFCQVINAWRSRNQVTYFGDLNMTTQEVFV